jgi:hypothetical protein
MTKTVEIRVDKERLKNTTTVDELIGLQEDNLRMIADVLSRYVIDGENGGYMDPGEARKIIGKMTMDQLSAAGKEFRERADDAAVPPESGAD